MECRSERSLVDDLGALSRERSGRMHHGQSMGSEARSTIGIDSQDGLDEHSLGSKGA